MCDVLHFSCHGTFAAGSGSPAASTNTSQVLDSSGLLFDGGAVPGTRSTLESKLLSMVDIWSLRVADCRLACVAACSGDTSSQTDECLSVGTEFLVAGARHVVCTMWLVQQVSAVLVMSRFFLNLYKRSVEVSQQSWSISQCLAETQSWYQILTPDEYCAAIEEET
jgi:CHAT domain-containing protein